MNSLLRFLSAALVVVCVFAGAVRAEPPKTTALAKCILRVDPEIDCPSCEDGIKRVLATAHGVQSADVDVLNNRITVRYDPARISVKALIGRIAVTGYTASEVK